LTIKFHFCATTFVHACIYRFKHSSKANEPKERENYLDSPVTIPTENKKQNEERQKEIGIRYYK